MVRIKSKTNHNDIMNSIFFNFLKPYLNYIDEGKIYREPFNWLYSILAVLNLIFPLYVLYLAIDNNIFDAGAKFIIVFLLIWIVIAFAGWIGFQIWWDRKNRVTDISSDKDEFVATPVFSHFIQTSGEWLGTWIAIVGFGTAVLTTIFLGDEARFFVNATGIGFLGTGFIAIFLMPIYGFLIIIASRFLSELFRAIAAIANNTKK